MDGTNSRPRSTQLMVHWRINSSKHWAYNSLRTWQIPVSRACLCSNFWSSCSCKLITSKRVAGVEETLCRHNWPCSSHSRGGRIESRISSVSLRALASDSESPSESFSPFFFLPAWYKLVTCLFVCLFVTEAIQYCVHNGLKKIKGRVAIPLSKINGTT